MDSINPSVMEWPLESLFAGPLVLDMVPDTSSALIIDEMLGAAQYWQIHLMWTIPVAVFMTILYWPFFTKPEMDKISVVVITSTVVSTVAALWPRQLDSYIAQASFDHPLQEILFFATSAYNTALLYTMLTKRLVMLALLARRTSAKQSLLGKSVIIVLFSFGVWRHWSGGVMAYMGLLLAWTCPFLMLEWVLCSRFLLALPRRILLWSIALPSMYLSIANVFASSQSAGYVIQDGSIYVQAWHGIDIEHTVLFWIINTIIIVGLVALDHAVAISEFHIERTYEDTTAEPPLKELIGVYLHERRRCHDKVIFLDGLSEAVRLVSRKSQSMYMGSAMFQGGLRIDLLLLYYFCRIMDDLVDEAPTQRAAELAIRQCSWALRCHFGGPHGNLVTSPPYPYRGTLDALGDPAVIFTSPHALNRAISLLPTKRMSVFPLLGLIDGFNTDLEFSRLRFATASPIVTEQSLETYSYNVASVVAVCIVHLVFKHYPPPRSPGREEEEEQEEEKKKKKDGVHNQAWDYGGGYESMGCRRAQIIDAAETMGQALQYVNIARDVERDAAIGRVYLPVSWLKEVDMSVADVMASPHDARVTKLRMRLLDKADEMYRSSEGFMNELPREARASIRAVVDSYMAIGREVRKNPRGGGKEKLKLSPWRRFWVVWRAMCLR